MSSSESVCILLVEDNPADALLVEEALSEHHVGGDVLVLGDGEKAIKLVDDSEANTAPCPKLVILDLNLPKRSGREVLQRIRESVRWRRIPVAILTSSNSPKDREDTARLGANCFIRKPSDLRDLFEIGAVLKRL